MKSAYIFFSEQRPKDHNSVMDLITHFCREHDLKYRYILNSDSSTITIDGNDYDINLLEKNEECEAAYWMIYCKLKSKAKAV